MDAIKIMDRDREILKELSRWRFCQGVHIRYLCNFQGQRTTDRRLAKLKNAGYVTYERPFVGMAGYYSLAHKGKVLLGVNKRIDKIRIDRVAHDIAVLNVACFFVQQKFTARENIMTEKELNSLLGFGNRQHQPDFIYKEHGKTIAVEIELTPKEKVKFEKNIKSNYLAYDSQIWVVPQNQHKILKMLQECKKIYDTIKILFLEEVGLGRIG